MSKNWSSLVLSLCVLIDTTASHGQKHQQASVSFDLLTTLNSTIAEHFGIDFMEISFIKDN